MRFTRVLANVGRSIQEARHFLGVSHTATNKEIHQAYLKFAKKHHPDVNKSDESSRLFQGQYFFHLYNIQSLYYSVYDISL